MSSARPIDIPPCGHEPDDCPPHTTCFEKTQEAKP